MTIANSIIGDIDFSLETMKKSLFTVALFVLVLLLAKPTFASEPFWIYGSIISVPHEATYNNSTFYEFEFQVNSSSASWITVYPLTLNVVVPIDIIINIALKAQTVANFTGTTDAAGFPEGYFLAEKINTQSSGSWIDSLKLLWSAITSMGSILVMFLIQIVEGLSGITLPSWVASLALIGVTTFVFFKFFKKLPIIIAITLFFVCIALVGSLMTGLKLF